jgi:hypothetical protein
MEDKPIKITKFDTKTKIIIGLVVFFIILT